MTAKDAYIQMILDGRAFSNWINPPSRELREQLVERIFNGEVRLKDKIDPTVGIINNVTTGTCATCMHNNSDSGGVFCSLGLIQTCCNTGRFSSWKQRVIVKEFFDKSEFEL